MWRMLRGGGAVAVLGLALTACTTAASIDAHLAAARTRAAGGVLDAVPFVLYTHCGIDELGYQGKWYERVGGPLDDGQGNPPSGWDNPEQRGALTIYASTAVFVDGAGHRETFALRPGASAPERVCS